MSKWLPPANGGYTAQPRSRNTDGRWSATKNDRGSSKTPRSSESMPKAPKSRGGATRAQ